MNGPTPIFPLNTLGQLASSLPDSAPAGEQSAFAETLTAALSASTQTAVASLQPAAKTPTTAPEDSLAGGLAIASTFMSGSTDQVLGDKATQALGDKAVQASASLGNLHDEAGSGSASATLHGNVTKADGRDVANDVMVGTGPGPELVPNEIQGETLGLANAKLTGRPADGLTATPEDRSTPVMPDRLGPPSIRPTAGESTIATPRALGLIQESHTSSEGSPSRVHLAGPIHDQDIQVARPAAPASRVVAEDSTRPTAVSAPVPSPDQGSDRPSQILVRPDVEKQSTGIPAASVDAHTSSRVSPTALGQSVNALPSPGEASRNRDTELVATQPTTTVRTADLAVFAASSRSAGVLVPNPTKAAIPASESGSATTAVSGPATAAISESALDDGSKRSLLAPTKSGGILTPTATSSIPSTLSAAIDTNVRPSNENSGLERLQGMPSAEAVVRDAERFEPAFGSNPVRTQTPAATPSTSAQIALQIVRSIPNGIDRLSVHLQPAELGSVDIQLNFEGAGRLSALITAERPETLELLQRDSRFLERSLGDSGLKLASDGLSFALRQDQQQQQQQQSFHEQAQARQSSFRANDAYDGTTDSEPAPSAQRVAGLRLLDIET